MKDFRITDKTNNKNTKLTNTKKESHNNNTEFIMKELASVLTQPTITCPSQKEEESISQSIGESTMSVCTLENKLHEDSESRMLNKLKKLEKTCESQKKEILKQRLQMEKVKTENAFLKGMKEDSKTAYDEIQKLQQKNEELNQKVREMENYLKKYGLKWVGNQASGKLNEELIRQQIKKSKFAYILPSEIDISTIKRRIDELNAGLEAEGFGTEIYNENGVHKFRKAKFLPIFLHANGIKIKGLHFYAYHKEESKNILADILDGYFPFVLKPQYPNGVLLEVIDRIEDEYSEIMQEIPSDFKENKTVFKKEIIEKINEEETNSLSEIGKFDQSDLKNMVEDFKGAAYLKTKYFSEFKKEQCPEKYCFLKMRYLTGESFFILMLKEDKIEDILKEIKNISQKDIILSTNFPKRFYTNMETRNLEQLGFFPSENIYISIRQEQEGTNN